MDDLEKWAESIDKEYIAILDEIREAHHPSTVALYFSLITKGWQASAQITAAAERKRILNIINTTSCNDPVFYNKINVRIEQGD